MKVLFLSMPVHKLDYSIGAHTMPPMAVYHLGNILAHTGHEVEIIDPITIQELNAYDEDDEILISFFREKLQNVSVVAFSCNTFNWPMSIIASKIVRKINPEIKIVVGGVHASHCYEYIMNNLDIDYTLVGDGDVSIVKLINAIESNSNFENVEGLVWRKDNKVYTNDPKALTIEDVKGLPLTDYSTLPEKKYNVLPIDTSRGCKFGCMFCSIPHQRCWFGYDAEFAAERAIAITDKYIDKMAGRNVYFVDDCFTADAERAKKILNSYIEAEPDVNIVLEARATDLYDEELLNILKQPQIIRVAIGVECGYNEGLKKISKGLTIEILEKQLQKFNEFGLIQKMYFSFI